MAIANSYTSASVTKSVNEIQEILQMARVQAMMIDFDTQTGTPRAISFRIECGGQQLHFRLPAEWRGVQQVLKKTKGLPKTKSSDEHAQCVSWRIVRDWVRAQLAMVEAGAAKLEEVMLPYLIVGPDTTLYQQFSQNNFKALPPPKESK